MLKLTERREVEEKYTNNIGKWRETAVGVDDFLTFIPQQKYNSNKLTLFSGLREAVALSSKLVELTQTCVDRRENYFGNI